MTPFLAKASTLGRDRPKSTSCSRRNGA